MIIRIDLAIYGVKLDIWTDYRELKEKDVRKFCKEAYKENFDEIYVKDIMKYDKLTKDGGKLNHGVANVNGGWSWIVLHKFDHSPKSYGLIAHEIFHVADMLCREKGLTNSLDSDEAWAYLISYITEEFYKKIL